MFSLEVTVWARFFGIWRIPRFAFWLTSRKALFQRWASTAPSSTRTQPGRQRVSEQAGEPQKPHSNHRAADPPRKL